MTLSSSVVAELADRLQQAEQESRPIRKITDDYPNMDWKDAYAVQAKLRNLKEARGIKFAGWKMGLTSFAKMAQMGVNEPVRGFLTDVGQITNGGTIPVSDLIHPRIEAEIGFVIARRLQGPGCHVGDVLSATDYIVPAVEVIDSRYEAFKFDLKSVIADNTSAARFICGNEKHSAVGRDLKNLGIVMMINDEIVATAAGSAVLGHPALSVAMLVNMLATEGQALLPGDFVMTGGATEAVAVKTGDRVRVKYQGIGEITAHCA